MKKLLMTTAAMLLLAGGANAAIIPVLESVTPVGSNFEFSYSGTLSGDAGVMEGSKLVIFDFAGFEGFGDLDASIVGSTELLTTTIPSPGGDVFPPPPGFTDDPSVLNLVFTYVGPPFQTTGGPYPTDVDFMVSALSRFQDVRLDGFSAVTVKNNGPAEGTGIFDVGATAVPTAVPEPATWAMMILGFGAAGALLRRRQESGLLPSRAS